MKREAARISKVSILYNNRASCHYTVYVYSGVSHRVMEQCRERSKKQPRKALKHLSNIAKSQGIYIYMADACGSLYSVAGANFRATHCLLLGLINILLTAILYFGAIIIVAGMKQ